VNIKTALKTSVAASALLALAAPVAQAGNVQDGGSNAFTFSGQIVNGLMYADSGSQEEWFQGDGGSTNSKVRFIATGNLNEDISIRGYYEMALLHSTDLSNATLTVNGETAGTTNSVGVNHAEIKFATKSMGSLEVGLGSTASNGRSEADFSGIGPAFSQGAIGSGSAIAFFDSGTAASFATSKTPGTLISAFDGRSKLQRIRYNLPAFNGLSLAVSTVPGGGGGDWDIGGSYTAMVGDLKTYVAAQNNWNSSSTSDGSWSMSAAVEHGSGLTLQGHYGTSDTNTAGLSDPTGYGVLVGYKAKLIEAGTTNFAFQFIQTDDLRAEGETAEAWMFGASQQLGAVKVHASYRQFELDDNNAATTYDDITSFFAGAVVTF